MATTTLYVQLEKADKMLPVWYSNFTGRVFGKIKEKNVEKIGERDYRIPVMTRPGGQFRTYDPNGGSYGRGTKDEGTYFTSTWYPMAMSFEITKLEDEATSTPDVAVKSIKKQTMGNALKSFLIHTEKLWHTQAGTALLATASAHTTWASGAKSVFTVDSVKGLRLGQPVRVMVNNQSAYRTLSTSYTEALIETIDVGNKYVYLNRLVDSGANNDVLVLGGVSGTTPVGMRGLQYWNSYATTGTTGGLDRSLIPEIWTPSANASSAAPTYAQGLDLFRQIFERRGEHPTGLIGAMSPLVAKSIRVEQINITDLQMVGDSMKLVDRTPKVDPSITWCNVQHFESAYQPDSRIDWIKPELWGWTSLTPLAFKKEAGSGNIYHQLYGSDGSPAAGVWFGLACERNSHCYDPGAQGVIYGITVS